MDWRACVVLSVVIVVHSRAEEALTLEAALARARAQAPAVVAAALRVEEARGRLRDARLRPNSVLEAAAAPAAAAGQGAQLDVELTQDLQVAGRRRARIAGGEAELARAGAEADDLRRELLGRVAESFLRVRHAEERLRLATHVEELSQQVSEAAGRRHEAGDIAVLELNLARSALARASADRTAAEASRAESLGDLKRLLGIPAGESLVLAGDLLPPPVTSVPALLAVARSRPDLRARGAELAEAEAGLKLALAERRPDLGLSTRYEREEGRGTIFGGVRLTLPVRNRGQGLEQEARARLRRVSLEQEAASRAVEVEVETAALAYRGQRAAVVALQAGAMPQLEENERLSARSYEVGQIGLAEYLLVRRELSETRAVYLDRLLEAALAWARLQTSAGMWP